MSSIVNSCRALRLRATVVLVAHGMAPGRSASRRRWRPVAAETHERRPDGTGVRVAYHPQGVRLDGHLLRGGAATRTVDHCTSPPFVPENRTRTRERKGGEARASPRSGGGRSAAPTPPLRRAPRAPGRASGPCPARHGRRAASTDDVRGQARCRGSSACPASASGDRELERAALAGQLLPLLDGALAERLSGRRASPARCPAARRRRSRSPTRCRRRSGRRRGSPDPWPRRRRARRSRSASRARPARRRSAPSR